MDNIDYLKNENDKLKQRINELEQHLKKYTNSKGHQEYFNKNNFLMNGVLINIKVAVLV